MNSNIKKIDNKFNRIIWDGIGYFSYEWEGDGQQLCAYLKSSQLN